MATYSLSSTYRYFGFILLIILSVCAYYASLEHIWILSSAPKSTSEIFRSSAAGPAPKIYYRDIPLSNTSIILLNTTTTVLPSNTELPSVPDKLPSTNVSVIQTPSKPTAVIIVTAKRSGSSFVGELFNQHPDVFYVFEPLWALDQVALKSKALNDTFLKTSIVILNATVHCDFHTGYPKQVLQKKSPFCFKNAKLSHTRSHSAVVSPNEYEGTCKKYKLVAVKVIRVHDVNDIRPLLELTDIELRVIHLIRDPRPTERSRMKTKPNLNLIRRKGTDKNDEVDLCHNLEQNMNFWKNTPSWLKSKYKMIRFEDIAASPQELAKELYDFVGLRMDDKIVKWIKENTAAKRAKSSKFSTRKNSRDILDAWRQDMAWTFVSKIQKSCFKPMEALGYVLFHDLNSLQDTHNPSTLPLQHS